jgi:SsrA-binding protein
MGPEVKSVREGNVNLQDGYATIEGGEAWLHGVHISPYDPADRWNADPRRRRKLLLQKSEVHALAGRTEQKGLTIVPLDLHFRGGWAKVTLGLARGKRQHDKREALRRRQLDREVEREIGRRR